MILFCKLTEYGVSTAERQKCGLDMWGMLHVFPPDMLTVVSMLCPDTTGSVEHNKQSSLWPFSHC